MTQDPRGLDLRVKQRPVRSRIAAAGRNERIRFYRIQFLRFLFLQRTLGAYTNATSTTVLGHTMSRNKVNELHSVAVFSTCSL